MISNFISIKHVMRIVLLPGIAFLFLVNAAISAEISSRRLVEVVDLAGPIISPDGKNVLFRSEQASVERNTYDSVWYIQSMDAKSQPRRIADGGLPLRNSAGVTVWPYAVWSPDSRWVYYLAMIDGRIDVWRAAIDGSISVPLTVDSADIRDFLLSGDGKTLYYSVGATREEIVLAEQSEYESGIHINEKVPIGQGLFRSGYNEGRLATQRFGDTWFDRAQLMAGVPDRWKALDLSLGIKRELTVPPKGKANPKGLAQVQNIWKYAVDPSGRGVAILRRYGDDSGVLQKPEVELSVIYDQKENKIIRCNSELCVDKPITGIQWRPKKMEVLFTITDPNKGNAQSIFLWNIRKDSVYEVTSSSGLIGGSRDSTSDCGLSSTDLVCVSAVADRPPRLEKINIDTGESIVMFAPNANLEFDIASAVRAQLIKWTDGNGQNYTGQFFPAQRKGTELPPLFLTYYNCNGFIRGGVGDEWPLITLAEKGISALCINQAPYMVDAIARFDQALSAVSSIVELLSNEHMIDPNKVGMGGLSFGSEVTYWTLMKSDLLAAASVSSVALSPNYYLFGSLKGENFFKGLYQLWQLKGPEETPDRWAIISPIFNQEKIKAPILMQMSEQEYIRPLDYIIPLIRDDKADLYVFPNEPHQKFQPRHKLSIYNRNIDWFQFWLQGYEDPMCEKVQQYKRWRMMRSKNHDREVTTDLRNDC